MHKNYLRLFNLALFVAATLNTAQAGDREQPFRKGKGGFRGNERSERAGRFVPGQLRHAGNGCPEGTMRVVFAPDNLSFTVLFDQFVADTATNQRGRRDRMGCEALLPVQIPEGQQMEITRVDYRGFVGVPAGGRATLHSVFNFVEGRGRKDRDRINIRYAFTGPLAENYELSTGDMTAKRGSQHTETSPCGGEALLKLKNEVMVMAPKGEQASLTVDSIDGSANAVYFVSWKGCRAR